MGKILGVCIRCGTEIEKERRGYGYCPQCGKWTGIAPTKAEIAERCAVMRTTWSKRREHFGETYVRYLIPRVIDYGLKRLR